MKKRLCLALLVALLLLVCAAPALATKPTEAAGAYQVIGLDPDRPGCVLLAMTGTLAGVVNICPSEHGAERGYFEGAVGAMEGTLAISFSATDRWVILGGGGDLANLHGQGIAVDDETGMAGTYSGRIHFDPR